MAPTIILSNIGSVMAMAHSQLMHLITPPLPPPPTACVLPPPQQLLLPPLHHYHHPPPSSCLLWHHQGLCPSSDSSCLFAGFGHYLTLPYEFDTMGPGILIPFQSHYEPGQNGKWESIISAGMECGT
ncbi:hypothetical protein CISG_10191 [Coccidioides immitis RMSCC 3703]|uniref:Uncharacterized protein n=1 Tax=Coccidioides immitis RMSCC 3703 TaxID=454286 RepID=A0A0J8TKJ5_COCIT|nr:hypothetical protein CISG_10191 [Coccidioides immitis RMSCC 3703]